MVIEFLTFKVDLADQETFLVIEEQTWSRYLEKRPGFLKKEIWKNRADSAEIHSVIWWTDQETWFTVSQEDIERVDASMGRWFRESKSMRIFDVVRQS